MGKITVLFNNTEGNENLKRSWGSSMLVEHDNESILFDVGPSAKDLFFNLDLLGINRKKIQKIVISHNHRDHRGALGEVLREFPKTMELYAPSPSGRVEGKRKIANHVYLVGIKGVFSSENVLVIDSPRGLILLVGCAHPGIYRISKTIKKDFGKNIYAILGGFHFEHYPQFFVRILGNLLKRLGVEIIGPNHCTGEKAIKTLQHLFKEGFLSFGGGKVFDLF